MLRNMFLLATLATAIPMTLGRADDAALERMKKDLGYLASDECEGRGLRTSGLNKAADYIAAAFKAAGLKPAMQDGSYFQPLVVKESFLEAGPQKLTLTGPLKDEQDLPLKSEFTVCGVSGKGIAGGELVFAGYGITAEKKYDDYAGLDVKGKVVVVMRQVPRLKSNKPFFNEAEVGRYGSLVAKVNNAVKRGAAGVIFINDADKADKDDPLMSYEYAQDSGVIATVPVLHTRRATIDRILASFGTSLAKREAAIDETLLPQSHELTGWSAKLQVAIGVRELQVKNVVGYLDGNGPLAGETVVFGAHYDHLGRGERGSLDPESATIHYGADDNASGTTGLLELIRRYTANKKRDGRRLLFIAFTAEERGLRGSQYYVDHPIFPLKDTVAMFNMDMIGRARFDDTTKLDRLIVGGVGSAKSFEKLLDDTNSNYNFKLEKSKSGVGPSDHTSFYMAKVPVYFFFTGEHPEYHTPKDVPATINFVGLKKVVSLVEDMANVVIMAKERPEYVAGMTGSMGGVRPGPKLGVVPMYDEAETRGMGISSVLPGGAAETAGIRKGDFITAIGSMPVKNVQDYMKAMGGLKSGQAVEITLDRNGKTLKVKATPN